MQFKHPELLYALFLLVIPVILHLFQLRKFQKEAFTNVAFLKKIKLQTRKSRQLKKWLTLLTRLLLFAAIILAFAQPFTSNNKQFITEQETVVYLDNSHSMQAKGEKGELLKRAVQDVVSQLDNNSKLSILTNNKTIKHTTSQDFKKALLDIDYSANQLPFDAAIIKAKKLFNKSSNSIKNLVLVSDFQVQNKAFSVTKDSMVTIKAVKLKPVTTNNIAIDSVFISKQTVTNTNLTILLSSNYNAKEIPLSVYNGETLMAKTAVDFKNNQAKTVIDLPADQDIKGQIIIETPDLQFDNSLFFNISKPKQLNVLSINNATDNYLRKLYSSTKFNYISTTLRTLDYSLISTSNTIILNELERIPNTLSNVLTEFMNKGGNVLVIPTHKNLDATSYNMFLNTVNITINEALNTSEKKITGIAYSHPIYNNGVFEKRVTNFQYPKVNALYNIIGSSINNVLEYEDGKAFLFQKNNLYMFTSALNTSNSNFKASPLIVPTFYNIACLSLKHPNLFYTIGEQNRFDVPANLQQDRIVSMALNTYSFIPEQRYFNNKITINTQEKPEQAGIYTVLTGDKPLSNVGFNFSRNESNLTYQNIDNIETITVSNSVENVLKTIKSETQTNALWKWFVIFALLLLIIEFLILKYFK